MNIFINNALWRNNCSVNDIIQLMSLSNSTASSNFDSQSLSMSGLTIYEPIIQSEATMISEKDEEIKRLRQKVLLYSQTITRKDETIDDLQQYCSLLKKKVEYQDELITNISTELNSSEKVNKQLNIRVEALSNQLKYHKIDKNTVLQMLKVTKEEIQFKEKVIKTQRQHSKDVEKQKEHHSKILNFLDVRISNLQAKLKTLTQQKHKNQVSSSKNLNVQFEEINEDIEDIEEIEESHTERNSLPQLIPGLKKPTERSKSIHQRQ